MQHSLEGFLEEVMVGLPAWSSRQMGWGGRTKGRNQPMPQAACALPGGPGPPAAPVSNSRRLIAAPPARGRLGCVGGPRIGEAVTA